MSTLEATTLPEPAGGPPGQAGSHQRRVFARVLDLLIFIALSQVAEPAGAALGLLYILIGDALWPGQSVGKRVFGVTVLRLPSGKAGHLGTSMLRNLPMAVALLLALLPLVSFVLFPTLGLALMFIESYLSRVDAQGRRLGDILGDCYVANVRRAPT